MSSIILILPVINEKMIVANNESVCVFVWRVDIAEALLACCRLLASACLSILAIFHISRSLRRYRHLRVR